jgi:hypothetical protein
MLTFRVNVTRTLTETATIFVGAESPEQAEDIVSRLYFGGQLEWSDWLPIEDECDHDIVVIGVDGDRVPDYVEEDVDY